jgi:hypothetical protein
VWGSDGIDVLPKSTPSNGNRHVIIGQDHRLVHNVQEDRSVCNAKTSDVVPSSANCDLQAQTKAGADRHSDVSSSNTLYNRCRDAVDLSIPHLACLAEPFGLQCEGVNAGLKQLSHELIQLLHLTQPMGKMFHST